jgi:hypothetical protein
MMVADGCLVAQKDLWEKTVQMVLRNTDGEEHRLPNDQIDAVSPSYQSVLVPLICQIADSYERSRRRIQRSKHIRRLHQPDRVASLADLRYDKQHKNMPSFIDPEHERMRRF